MLSKLANECRPPLPTNGRLGSFQTKVDVAATRAEAIAARPIHEDLRPSKARAFNDVSMHSSDNALHVGLSLRGRNLGQTTAAMSGAENHWTRNRHIKEKNH